MERHAGVGFRWPRNTAFVWRPLAAIPAAPRAFRCVMAAALAAIIVGAPIPARGQFSDVVNVTAVALGADCFDNTQGAVFGEPQLKQTPGVSATARSEFFGTWCDRLGGGTNRERAEASVDVENAGLRLFASVVNVLLNNWITKADASASAAYAVRVRLRADRGTKNVGITLRLGGFIGSNPTCGLVGGPAPPPGSSCAEATLQSANNMYDWAVRNWVGRGPLSLNSSNMSAGGRPRLFSLASPVFVCRTTDDPNFEDCIFAGPNLTLRALVQGQGVVDLANTATLYLELPEGATFLGSLGGNLGIARSDFVIQAGQAIPDPAGSLTISPGSGVLVPGQAFDLGLTFQTAGQAVVGAAATLDGGNVSAPLIGCLGAHVGALSLGTPGFVARCPGFNGSFFAPGTHTLAVTLALSGGGTLTDTVVWEVPGAGPPAGEPRLEVSPPAGPLAQNQAFDLVLFADPAGRAVVGRQVTFDDRDVTALVAGCPQTTLPSGQIVLRRPGLTGGFLGLGSHTLQVTFSLSDGSTLEGGAVWRVLAAPGS